MDIYRIADEPIDVIAALAAIADPKAGGQAVFLGTVRDHFDGVASRGLFYEAYRQLAEKEMTRIGAELKQEFGVLHVVMIHRVGELALTETAVLVAISSGHRHEAIEACHAGIDRIKSRAPIWKKERWASGLSQWHHEANSSETPL